MLGVQRKLADMAKAARKAELPIDFVLINREHTGVIGGLKLVCADEVLGAATGLKLRALKYYYLQRLAPVGEYDALILRYHYADPSMFGFMKQHKGKVFFEHHTKELYEIWRSGMPFLLKLVTYGFEKTIAPYCLRKAEGVIAVTQEFLDHQIDRARLPADAPVLVLPNGALFTDREIKLCPIGAVLRFVFVADRFRPWHGLSRLLASMAAYQGGNRLELALAGQLSESQLVEVETFNSMGSNVRVDVVGVLSQQKLLQLLSGCHIAIDSLSTFELDMQESSTLKVRLYLEAGIPWFSATPDSDVGANSHVCFLVPNEAPPFNVEDILRWREQLNAEQFNDAVVQLRARVDWREKLKTLNTWVCREL